MDCALAELYVRTMATDRLVKDTAQAEIFNSIFTRMNEVRGMLHGEQAQAMNEQHLAVKWLPLRLHLLSPELSRRPAMWSLMHAM